MGAASLKYLTEIPNKRKFAVIKVLAHYNQMTVRVATLLVLCILVFGKRKYKQIFLSASRKLLSAWNFWMLPTIMLSATKLFKQLKQNKLLPFLSSTVRSLVNSKRIYNIINKQLLTASTPIIIEVAKVSILMSWHFSNFAVVSYFEVLFRKYYWHDWRLIHY